MEQRLSSRFWIILVAGFLVVIGLGLLLALLARRPGEPIPTNVGPEIHEKALARALDALLTEGAIVSTGERRWRKYRLSGR